MVHGNTGRVRTDMVGNQWNKGRKPWNAGKKGVYTKEAREAMAAAKRGCSISESQKNKTRSSMESRWNDPAYRARHHKAMLKVGKRMRGENNVTKRLDVRAKLSEAASRPEVIDSKARKMPYSGTSIELLMRAELKRRGIAFEANKQLEGKYNVDIFIKPSIVVECDGDYWHNLPRLKLKDRRRDGALKTLGYRVFRFWEHDIHRDMSKCVDRIAL